MNDAQSSWSEQWTTQSQALVSYCAASWSVIEDDEDITERKRRGEEGRKGKRDARTEGCGRKEGRTERCGGTRVALSETVRNRSCDSKVVNPSPFAKALVLQARFELASTSILDYATSLLSLW